MDISILVDMLQSNSFAELCAYLACNELLITLALFEANLKLLFVDARFYVSLAQ